MKVGDKVIGFEHAGDVAEMEGYIGKIGKIITLTDYDIELEFNDGESWFYPFEESKKYLVTENNEPQTDSIVESVINQFKQRSEAGINKYGTTLDRNDLSTLEWIEHAKQEAMDFILYLEKLKHELK